MKPLTNKQQQIYDFIISFSEQNGYPPSVREIGEHVGLKSPSTVHFHLKGLEEAGLIAKAEGKTRAITVTGPHAEPERDQIPVVGNVAAGSPILAQEQVEDYLTFETGDKAGEYFALRVRGESRPHLAPAGEPGLRAHRRRRLHHPGQGHRRGAQVLRGIAWEKTTAFR